MNREDIDLGNADEIPPTHSIWLGEDLRAEYWYPLPPGKFLSVSSVTLVFSGSLGGAPDVDLFYIGMKGFASGVKREAIRGLVYESRPQMEDHKVYSGGGAGVSQLGI